MKSYTAELQYAVDSLLLILMTVSLFSVVNWHFLSFS